LHGEWLDWGFLTEILADIFGMEDSMGSLLYLPTPTFTLTFFLPGKKFFSKNP